MLGRFYCVENRISQCVSSQFTLLPPFSSQLSHYFIFVRFISAAAFYYHWMEFSHDSCLNKRNDDFFHLWKRVEYFRIAPTAPKSKMCPAIVIRNVASYVFVCLAGSYHIQMASFAIIEKCSLLCS